MARLTLSLLGAFEASLDGKPLSGIKTDKARALLIYLAVERGRAHRRQVLAGLLWPDYPEDGARANLRHALANLRQVLGEEQNQTPFLLIEGETLQLNPECDCLLDVAEFEKLAATNAAINDLESAILLYRGGFLEGFTLKDSPDFDNWTAILRERYQGFASSALGRLAEGYEQNKNYEKAIGYSHQRLELEPWQEEAHQQLMRLLALSGQRAAALAQYENCRKILKEELAVEPSVETRRLQASIRDGEISASKQEKVRLHNLPAQVTSFIGRQKEIDEIKSLLGRGVRRAPTRHAPTQSRPVITRLVTLTGPGGTGKTRLTLQTAEELLEQFPDGTWLVELAPLTDPEQVVQTVARTLGMRLESGVQVRSALQDFLEPKYLLLILDNCEHLVEACARLADALLHICPHLTILASSREALGIEGEVSYRVPPLTIPEAGELPPVETLEQYEAVCLFVERARAASPSFQMSVENAPAIAQICQRLDGIPLALELSAARVKLMRVEEIAGRLDDRFRLLTGGSRSALPRYQTLRASIDWSYDLLSASERILLQRLSVFAGGWGLEATEYVGCGENIESCDVLDLLSQLVNKSLVTVKAEAAPTTRYRMLETIRQYAHEKLVESGESEFVRDRHLMYYVELAEKFEEKIRGWDQAIILSSLEVELDNIRLALGWSMEGMCNPSYGSTSGQRIEHGLRLAAVLLWFWHLRGRYEEGLQWLEHLLAAQLEESAEQDFDPAGTKHRAEALLVAGWLATQYGENPKAVELFEESRVLFQKLGPEGEFGVAHVHFYLGAVAYYQGNLKLTEKNMEECLVIFSKRGDRFMVSECPQLLGVIAIAKREYARARMVLDQNLALKRELGDQDGIADMLYLLGVVSFYEQFQVSDPTLDERTSALFEESLKLFRKINSAALCKPFNRLGYIKWSQGNYSKAAEYFDDVLSYSRKIDLFGRIVQSLSHLGFLALSQGDFERAAEMFDESLAITQKRDHKGLIAWSHNNLGALALEKEDFEQAGQEYARALRISQELGDTETERDALCGLGRVSLARGDVGLSRTYLLKALEISQNHFDPQASYYILEMIALQSASPLETTSPVKLERAAELLAATQATFAKWRLTRTPKEREMREAAIASVRETLGEEGFSISWQTGQAMPFQQAVENTRSDLSGNSGLPLTE